MGRLSLWFLCGLTLLAVSLNDVQVSAEVGPTESECKPYIEKAIKELKTGESDKDDDDDNSKEIDDINKTSSEHIKDDDDDDDGDGDNDDDDDKNDADGKSGENEDGDDDDESGNTEEHDTDGKSGEDDNDDDDDKDNDTKESDDADVKSAEDQSDDDDDKKSEETDEAEGDEDKKSDDDDHDDGDDDDDDDKKSGQLDSAEDNDTGEKSGENQDEDDDDDEKSTEKDTAEDDDDDDEDKDGKSGEVDDDDDNDKKSDEVDDSKADHDDDDDDDDDKKSAEKKDDDDDDDEDDAKKSGELDEDDNDSKEHDSKPDDDDDDKDDDEDKNSKEKSTDDDDDNSKESSTDDDKDDDDDDHDKDDDAKSGEEDKDDDHAESGEKDDDDDDDDHKADDDDDDDDDDKKSAEEVEETITRSKRSVDESKPAKVEDDDDDDDDDNSEEKDIKKVEEKADDDDDDDDSGEKKDDDDDDDDDHADVKKPSDDDDDDDDDDEDDEEETRPEDDLLFEGEIPENLRDRKHIDELLHLNDEDDDTENAQERVAGIILRDVKRIYENAIKPLETLYKYRDLSNRHFSDPEIFSKPLILFMGPWSGGKSSIINYLTDNEYKSTSLRSGAEPSPAYFNILMWGNETEVLDGTQLAADWTFSGLQKFGQGLEERLRGLKMPNKLLEKVNIVEIPGILEVRKQVSRHFPFNDACQWFIDRADIIFLIYDPAKLDVGPETEAILDQLKGREYQTRIVLNKADTVKPEELLRVQGALIWNISPLMSSAQPPVMYTTSLWSKPYDANAPVRLLQAQERAFLRDLRTAVDKRIDNRIASARRFAVRVRNHAKMVDCYLNTYYNHKTIFGNKKRISDEIINNPQNYHIYEGLSTLTNISRYDLPDPDVYRDFFRLNPLYEFKKLSETCTYFRGCPINKLDVAIAYDLPELVGKYKKTAEEALRSLESKNTQKDSS